jgi:hypothetical protein
MPDVSITDLTTEARKKFRESPGWELGIHPGSDLDLVRRLADALEAAERDAQQAEDQANNLAGDVAQLKQQLAAVQAFITKYTGHIGSYLSEYGTTVEVEEFERELEALTEGEKR